MQRRLQPELMDDPELDQQLHRAALAGLARLNSFSRSAAIVWPPVCALAGSKRTQRLAILDIATGAGDVPLGLYRRAKRNGLVLEITACDISPVSLEYGQARARQAQAPIVFQHIDALHDELPTGFDCVISSLFLHHLAEQEAELLLRKMAQAGQLVIINDLVRSRLNYWAVFFATRVLSRSPIVHTDGPLSIRAAYTIAEVKLLADRAGLTGARIARRHPCRFLLTWSRS